MKLLLALVLLVVSVPIAVAEKRLVIADQIASRIAVMGHGEIVFDGSLDAFRQRADVAQDWLGVG